MTTDSIGFGHVDLGTDPLAQTPPTHDVVGGGAFGGDARPCASYTLRVNGFERPVTDAWIGESLLYVLRERLGLAGAKDGCEQGECGACSVQVDGQLVAGCLVPAALASDSEIATVEGLSAGGTASDVQQALADSGAVQCGYCTPGMAMAVHDLLQRNHRPSEVEARQALCGNLCRCTGYRGALAAVQVVAEARGAVDELPEQEEPEQADPPEAAAPSAVPVAVPVQSAADLSLAGEMPLYADSEAWVEAEQPHPAQPTAAGTGIGVGIDAVADYGVDYGDGQGVGHGVGHGGAATTHQTGVYEPADYPPYPATPPYNGTPPYDGTPYDASYDATFEQSRYEATPAHGTAHDGPPFEGTPAHGTPYTQTPAHGTPYDSAAYENATYETATYETSTYETSTYENPSYDNSTVYEHTGYDGSTPAHGIPLPEDDHA
ncbi:aerobic-type carbon monoxide dehydrogenase small subunit (CoxS/CutS family) [Kitasatospora sp. MAP5-34]|nr:aerobic-type carbon monoxide dehydrogenase small subunit (CoxS/CutS family) [Kitasatospora sp. MAP5-34]